MSIFNLRNNSSNDIGSNMEAVGGNDQSLQAKVIIDSIEDGVVMIDPNHTIQLMNPGAAAICGWKTEEAIGISADLVIQLINAKRELIPNSENPLHKIFETNQSFTSNNYELLTRDKKYIPISLHISPLLDKQNNTYMAIAVINNISEARTSEKQRADFISTASHEMRTPVAAIEGYLALALNDKVSTIDDRARGYLEKAHSSTQLLGKLFQDLLTSAKAEDGRLPSRPTVIELGEFLTQLTNDLRIVAEKKGLAMDYSAGSKEAPINATTASGGERVVNPLFYVYVDPDRLREVISNLFDNAVKYTPEGKITIGLTGSEQVVQCYVKDTGPGIPTDDLPHLFQKFYRVDNSVTRTIGGTGLGLFICRKIIELYNGRIWAESVLGKGSTFYINLPRISTQKAVQMQRVGQDINEIQPISSLAST